MVDESRLDNDFTYHKPKEGMPEIFQDIRSQAKILAKTINGYAPEGREKSLALTKVEEAVMWANAGIARQGDPQK